MPIIRYFPPTPQIKRIKNIITLGVDIGIIEIELDRITVHPRPGSELVLTEPLSAFVQWLGDREGEPNSILIFSNTYLAKSSKKKSKAAKR